MESKRMADNFRLCLKNFSPTSHSVPRTVAMFSASVAIADEELIVSAVEKSLQIGVKRGQLYEAVLQSYLFLGFPRMLIATESLHRAAPASPAASANSSADAADFHTWTDRGVELCKKVYGRNYDSLKLRVESMAPEVFQWMVLEGYGKVLSRPGLDSVSRELASVACLLVDNRPAQLYAHMRGALNVGASDELLRTVVTDIGAFAGDGHVSALEVLARFGEV